MTALLNLTLVTSIVLAGCGGDSDGPDATVDATTDAMADATSDAAPGDAMSDGAADGGDDAGGGMCTDYDVGQLCVRGMAGDAGEMLTADAPVRFMITPNGCHSSACTVQEIADCSAMVTDSTIAVEGRFCLRTEGECTLPDCGGGGFAECTLGDNLPEGDYTATLGDLSVSFTIPSMVDFGGACDGTPEL
jgi:hypothetical protein